MIYLILRWAPNPNRRKLPKLKQTVRPKKGKTINQDPRLSVMTWNIGFGGGEKGNPTRLYSQAEVIANLSEIEESIKTQDPDILLLQEVDMPSKRTGMIDEYKHLMDNLDFRYGCFVTTWKCNHVPFPFTLEMTNHLGKINSGQAILSKMPITDCKEIRLPQPEHNSWVEAHFAWWQNHVNPIYRVLKSAYNRFYMHRTIQIATIDIGLDNHVSVLNCHLEAFDQQNREDQADILYKTIASIQGPLIVGGDFNTLPPDATKKRGFSDEDIDFTTDQTMEKIMQTKELRDTLTDSKLGNNESETFTFPAYAPTRRLDYVLERGFMLVPPEAGVIHTANGSDHLPITANIIMK